MKLKHTLLAAIACTIYGATCAQPAYNQRYGQPLATMGDTTYYINYNLPKTLTHSSENVYGLIRGVKNGKTIKRTIVTGLNVDIASSGDNLCMILGTDTVSVPLSSLEDKLDIGSQFMIPNTTGESYRYTFSSAAGRRMPPCEFRSEIYTPKADVEWLMPYLVNRIKAGFSAMGFNWNAGKGNMPTSLTDLMIGAAHDFEKMYRAEFSKSVREAMPYSYFVQVLPVWQSSNKTYLTFYVMTSVYSGGAHGNYTNYYITFNTTSKQPVTFDEILSSEGGSKAVSILGEQLSSYLSKNDLKYYSSSTPDVEDVGNSIPLIYERYNGKVYPRPALMRRGIVFAFQPYVKAPYSFGTLMFTVPYTELYGLMNITL